MKEKLRKYTKGEGKRTPRTSKEIKRGKEKDESGV